VLDRPDIVGMPYLTPGGSEALTPVFCSIATHGPDSIEHYLDLIMPNLAALTLATLVMRMRSPRPRFRRIDMPIGMASCRGWDENGLAEWTLTIGGQLIEGRWVIIDREFRPAGQHRRPDRRLDRQSKQCSGRP
jgi:hypothetical protein